MFKKKEPKEKTAQLQKGSVAAIVVPRVVVKNKRKVKLLRDWRWNLVSYCCCWWWYFLLWGHSSSWLWWYRRYNKETTIAPKMTSPTPPRGSARLEHLPNVKVKMVQRACPMFSFGKSEVLYKGVLGGQKRPSLSSKPTWNKIKEKEIDDNNSSCWMVNIITAWSMFHFMCLLFVACCLSFVICCCLFFGACWCVVCCFCGWRR